MKQPHTLYFTVGPSQLYPTIPDHIRQALNDDVLSISHRSSTFTDWYKKADANLRTILRLPDTHHIFFTASALEGMERTIQNTVKEHSFHFINGSFSREFYQIALDYNKKALRFDAPNGEGFKLDDVTVPPESELICFVQNETSTGVNLPVEDIYTIADQYPDKLIAVDMVSSLPYLDIDFTKIDCGIFSIQKGFGLPAGLGVIIVSDRAIQKAQHLAEEGIAIGSHHNFLKLKEFADKHQTRETPNVLGIYLLSKVTEDIRTKGIDVIRKEIDEKASLIYTFFENHPKYKPFTNGPYRSKTTIVIDVQGESEKIVNLLKKNNIIVAKGYGKRKDSHIRIANFPSHTIGQVQQLLQVLANE